MTKPTTILAIVILLTGNISVHAQSAGYTAPGYYPNGYYRPAYIPAPRPYRYSSYPGYRYPGFYPAYSRPPVASIQNELQPPAAEKQDIHRKQTESKIKTANIPAEKKQLPATKITNKSSNKIPDRKQKFIDLLLPYIKAENKLIMQQREWLRSKFNSLNLGNRLSRDEQNELKTLASKYRITASDFKDTKTQQELLKKIDIIPASLTLAQAANESAWGQSRFAREANNLFGIWTYDADKGLKPKNRESGKKHYVRKFDSVGASVRYYMLMLNSHPAYAELRQIRHQQRNSNQSIDGHLLAQGLKKYSAKGTEYISLIRQLITQNQWALLDTTGHQA